MVRRAAKVDGNQPAIVAALRAVGVTVSITSAVGGGFPDIVLGYKERSFLVEIKDPSKPKGDQKLTPDQVEWHREWKGQKAVVRTIEEAFAVVGIPFNP